MWNVSNKVVGLKMLSNLVEHNRVYSWKKQRQYTHDIHRRTNKCKPNNLLHITVIWSLATLQMPSLRIRHTPCSEKNSHSCFVLYFGGKCLDFHKIFRECLAGNSFSNDEKVTYSLQLVTSCWPHNSVFVRCRFYYWRQAFDEMFKHINWSLC